MAEHHISSILVSAQPAAVSAVSAAIAALPDTEVRLVEGCRIIAVLEGPDSRSIGDRLTRIALMDGVLAANMVFEHIESVDPMGESV